MHALASGELPLAEHPMSIKHLGGAHVQRDSFGPLVTAPRVFPSIMWRDYQRPLPKR